MKQPDLFGGQTEVVETRPRGWAEAKRLRNYRTAEDKTKSCKTCKHRVTKQFSKNYHKCELLTLSATPSGDIRLKCVCNLWALSID